MVHSWRKLITGVLIPITLLWAAFLIKPVDDVALAYQDTLRIIACVAIGMEIILLIEQSGLHRRFEWRENLLRSRLLNNKIIWIALPFILAFISYTVKAEDMPGRIANAMPGRMAGMGEFKWLDDKILQSCPFRLTIPCVRNDGSVVSSDAVFSTALEGWDDKVLQSCALRLTIPCFKNDGSVVASNEVLSILRSRHPPPSPVAETDTGIVSPPPRVAEPVTGIVSPPPRVAGTVTGIVPNNMDGKRASRAIANVFLIAAVMVTGFDMLWLVKSGLGFFVFGASNNFRGTGVFFGMMRGGRMAGRNQDEDGHILVVGGAGTGKSSSIAIPTLAKTWTGNFLVIDIKGELAKESGRQACIFNPCDPGAYGYDPFYFVEKQDNPTAALQEIAMTLIPESPGVKEPFWIQSAQSILTGHLIYTFSQGASFYDSLKSMQTIETRKLLRVDSEHEEASIYVNKFLDTPQETLGSIMAHVSNAVVPLIGDPDIKRALTRGDSGAVIVPDMLDRGESIFLQIPMGKIDLWKNFITLIVQQFLGHFQRREERANQPVLFLLDEFARFGRMDGIMNGLATLRSKKVSICLIIQSLAQLDAIYGEANRKVITDNCVYKAILGASDADTQAYFSRMAGTQKMQQVTRTTPEFNLFSRTQGQSSKSTTMIDEPIIRPEEFGRLGNRLLLLTPDMPATFVKKRPYYQW